MGCEDAERCELCGAPAAVHCAADAAFLCASCDAKVHGANFVARASPPRTSTRRGTTPRRAPACPRPTRRRGDGCLGARARRRSSRGEPSGWGSRRGRRVAMAAAFF
jgi:hypothetical protein